MVNLSLNNLRKSYGGVDVIKGVDFDVVAGEFLVFVGPSGCGKSTLLRMIAGLEDITSGDLLIDGERVNDVAPDRRGLAMVFQSYALYPHMTIEQNMGFALQLSGVPKDERRRKVLEAAKILHLENLLDRRPGQLSGGQRQRVAIGRAIVRSPKVFLFDEPLSNLDAALRVKTRMELASLHKRLKGTMIYVTHDQVEAMTMADRIVVLRDGIVEQIGAPLELYNQPANLFVAGFIGSPKMNFIPAVRSSDTATVSLSDGTILPLRDLAKSDDNLTIGIRPDMVTIVEAGGVAGIIALVERLGNETHLHVQTAICAEPLTVSVNGQPAFLVGDELLLEIDASRVHVFDANGIRVDRQNKAEH